MKKLKYKTWAQTRNNAGDLDLTVLLQLDPHYGIEETGAGRLVRIFPNPARNAVTIESPDLYKVMIYSPDGRLMRSRQMKQPTETIDLTGLGQGVYLVHFSGNGPVFARKLVVE